MNRSKILSELSTSIEKGKINSQSNWPPDMIGKPGADELTKQALESGAKPNEILSQCLIPAMEEVGRKFRENLVFLPEVLMASRAMSASMEHLKPWFVSGEIKKRGTIVIGTVQGDLHDIGKNLVGMIIEGAGWEVIDLGVDVSENQFIEAVKMYPGCVVGLSALLTTTMVYMQEIIASIKKISPETIIIVGGAPLNRKYAANINADFYSPDPQGAVEYLNNFAENQ